MVPEKCLAFLKKEIGITIIKSKRNKNKAKSDINGYILPKIKSYTEIFLL
jgi:hypothetical protein